MRLIDLKIARGGSIVRTVAFKQGLNLILDKPTTSATHSGNNVGKTTLLRLIDFCLGSDGKDIWQDAEFPGAINQDVHAFLTGTVPASITLRLRDEAGGQHTSTRHFSKGGTGKEGFEVDGATYKSANAFKATLKGRLFGSKDAKPTLRQLIPKFVRSSPERMRRTLRFLGDYGSKADYEALHLFLFGFFATDVLGDRLDQTALKKSLSRDLEGLNRLRKEGEIEQLLLHLQREIRELSQSNELRGEVPEIAERANLVSRNPGDGGTGGRQSQPHRGRDFLPEHDHPRIRRGVLRH